MKKTLLLLIPFVFLSAQAQTLKSPSEFLGYTLGTEFSRHYEVLDYYRYLAQNVPDQVKMEEYGKTNERRSLILVYVSAPENLSDLENIRKEHLKAIYGEGNASKAIVWLSYNVHGNESVGTEASMQTIYELLTTKKDYLKNTVVIIDPCINPDGRDRYINWYHQYKNSPHQEDPNSKEHHEGWWTGRSNHYMFDLNRDWAWLTQKESQQRIKHFNKWLPHVHVDFHEQSVDNPYFFAPAAEPYHEVVTKFQRDFQGVIGKNHAKYFDANEWSYFTKEVYDLFYPSYGDTYPTYNGAIGMTYEQGGSGRAGLAIINRVGDTLTLNDRIAHHLTTGLSTIEVSSKNAEKLNEEFKKFYQSKKFKYKSYVMNGTEDHISTLKELLSRHKIQYGHPSKGTVKGYHYKTGNNTSMPVTERSLVVSTNQPKGTLVKVLFEPKAKLTDSLTYDITAWSLPYAYGLDAVASTNLVLSQTAQDIGKEEIRLNEDAYAYIADWNSMSDARFLADLLKLDIRVRKSNSPFSIEGKSFDRGSLIITSEDNKRVKNFFTNFSGLCRTYGKEITVSSSGFVDSGKDFGSSSVRLIQKPKIGILSGKPTSTYRFGEIWHFFEQQLEYPISVLDGSYFKSLDISEYQILILPDGGYGSFLNETGASKLTDWVKKGGKLIVMGRAIDAVSPIKEFTIKKNPSKDSTKNNPRPYKNTQRENIKRAITGAIFNTKVDNTHPLAFGYGSNYFTLKLGSSSYAYLKTGNVVYFEDSTEPVSGFAGSEARKNLGNSLVFGTESLGTGTVVYMVDNPLFRGFWENGKLFFANALFMVD